MRSRRIDQVRCAGCQQPIAEKDNWRVRTVEGVFVACADDRSVAQSLAMRTRKPFTLAEWRAEVAKCQALARRFARIEARP